MIDKENYNKAKIELYSLIEQNNDIHFFVQKSLTKYNPTKDEWLENWLIKKVMQKIKEENKLSVRFLDILLKNGFDHISRTIIEEVTTKYIQERLYNDTKDELSYEKDTYDF